MTFAEFDEVLEGYKRRQRDNTNDLLYLAWHVAVWSRCDPKDFPKNLKDVLIKDKPQPTREMTVDEQLAMLRLMNAAFGGNEVVGDGTLH
jgi:hypothetical protein